MNYSKDQRTGFKHIHFFHSVLHALSVTFPEALVVTGAANIALSHGFNKLNEES